MTIASAENASWYLDATEDQLFTRLGSILLGEGLGAGSIDPGSRRRFGHEWFDANLKKLQNKVCGSKLMTDVIQNTPGDLATVTTAILPLVNDQLLSIAVAAIILRTGIATFCAGWSEL